MQRRVGPLLVFLYREILGIDLCGVDALRSHRPRRAPVVLSRNEVGQVLCQLEAFPRLMASLLYGAGLRLSEGQRLRVKDVDFGNGLLLIRASKNDKDRRAILSQALQQSLSEHLHQARTV